MPSPLAPTLTPAATAALAAAKLRSSELKPADAKSATGFAAKARAVAEDFEAVFVNSMFQQMFAHVGEGPFGGGPGASIWRSLLTDEYAKSFVKAGGVGIADQVQRELLATQEAR